MIIGAYTKQLGRWSALIYFQTRIIEALVFVWAGDKAEMFAIRRS